MIPAQKSLFLILILALSFINCNRNNFMKKGIVLKCQGNPVSCYGKRSSDLTNYNQDTLNSNLSSDEENSDLINIQKSLDLLVEDLALNCNTGHMASCKRLRKIILMNSDR